MKNKYLIIATKLRLDKHSIIPRILFTMYGSNGFRLESYPNTCYIYKNGVLRSYDPYIPLELANDFHSYSDFRDFNLHLTKKLFGDYRTNE